MEKNLESLPNSLTLSNHPSSPYAIEHALGETGTFFPFTVDFCPGMFSLYFYPHQSSMNFRDFEFYSSRLGMIHALKKFHNDQQLDFLEAPLKNDLLSIMKDDAGKKTWQTNTGKAFQFRVQDNGKFPFIVNSPSNPLHSLSHTHGPLPVSFFGFTASNQKVKSLGVDVEWKSRSATLTQKHGDYFLNSNELQALERSENFQRELFNLWSLKESAFKCFYQNHPAPDLLLKHIHLKDFDPISSHYVFENSLQKNTFCQSRFYSLAIHWDDPKTMINQNDDLLLSMSLLN